MSDKEMVIEMPVEETVEETETKTKTTLGQKVKNLGLKVKGGAKKVVDSKAFRIVTGVVSTVAVGAVALSPKAMIRSLWARETSRFPIPSRIRLRRLKDSVFLRSGYGNFKRSQHLFSFSQT